jgi:glycosyltransferase involved in cell wall biosynthesis
MSQKKSWIAYVGPFLFPWGQPGSRRVCGIARSFADAGYDVVIGSGGAEPSQPTNLDEGEEPGSITYLGLGEVPAPGTSLVDKSLQLFMHWGTKTVAWLDAQPNKPSHIVLYGGSAQYMFRLLPWCKRNNVPLIVDVVEWYDASHMAGGFFGPFHISAKIALRYYYPKCDGIIAISSYLAEHYRQHGCTVVTVPPTLDVKNHSLIFNEKDTDQSRLTLVYAGTPGKKDLLTNVIRGIAQIDADGRRVRLLVMGPTLEQVKQLLNGSEPPAFVQVLGRIPQTEVAKIVQQSDFSVLLREPLRFAQAGFPTKFVESMTNGTPVMANLTSDLGRHLHDGVEGLVCRDHSASAFAETLQRALILTPAQLQDMCYAARKQAESSFDFHTYTDSLSNFLDEIRR